MATEQEAGRGSPLKVAPSAGCLVFFAVVCSLTVGKEKKIIPRAAKPVLEQHSGGSATKAQGLVGVLHGPHSVDGSVLLRYRPPRGAGTFIVSCSWWKQSVAFEPCLLRAGNQFIKRAIWGGAGYYRRNILARDGWAELMGTSDINSLT